MEFVTRSVVQQAHKDASNHFTSVPLMTRPPSLMRELLTRWIPINLSRSDHNVVKMSNESKDFVSTLALGALLNHRRVSSVHNWFNSDDETRIIDTNRKYAGVYNLSKERGRSCNKENIYVLVLLTRDWRRMEVGWKKIVERGREIGVQRGRRRITRAVPRLLGRRYTGS